jgi:hypothetical protein
MASASAVGIGREHGADVAPCGNAQLTPSLVGRRPSDKRKVPVMHGDGLSYRLIGRNAGV